MMKSIMWAVLFFFVQPTLWLGLWMTFRNGNKRIQNERKHLRIAVYKDLLEVKEYLLGGLLIGVLISAATVLAGIPVTFEWILFYEGVTLLLALFGYRFLHPAFTFTLPLLLLSAYYAFIPGSLPSFQLFGTTFLAGDFALQEKLAQSVLLLAGVILGATALLLIKKKEAVLSPALFKTKRGKTVAGYPIQTLRMIPLLLVVPGSAFQSFFSWWPVFKIGNGTYTFFLLPVLAGLRYTLKAQEPEAASLKLGKELLLVSAVSLVFVISSFWFTPAALIGSALLLVLAFGVLYRHRKREQSWHFIYGPEEEGWKVIAVRPDTPGEKMGLQIGDTILDCNHLTKEKMPDFSEAISSNRVYCKLRIKRADGEIRLAEAAVFDDAPFDLGIVTLENSSSL